MHLNSDQTVIWDCTNHQGYPKTAWINFYTESIKNLPRMAGHNFTAHVEEIEVLIAKNLEPYGAKSMIGQGKLLFPDSASFTEFLLAWS